MRLKYLLIAAALIGTSVFITVWCAEVYTLVADAKLPVRRVVNEAVLPDNILLTLESGEKLKVTQCIDYKSDIAIQVSVSENVLGYVSDGDFHLERVRWPYRYFLSDPHRLVWSCGSFFNGRKIDA